MALFAIPVGLIGAAYILLALASLLLPCATPRQQAPTPSANAQRAINAGIALLCWAHVTASYLVPGKLLPLSSSQCSSLHAITGLACHDSDQGRLVTLGLPFTLLAAMCLMRCANRVRLIELLRLACFWRCGF